MNDWLKASSNTNHKPKYEKYMKIRKKWTTFWAFHPLLFLRWIQLPESGFAIQTRVLVLLDSNLHAVLYVGDSIMGVVLAGSRCCAGSSFTRCHYTPNYGNANVGNQCISSAGILHKSHWRMDRSVSDVCVRSAAGVCARQLCLTFRLVKEIN